MNNNYSSTLVAFQKKWDTFWFSLQETSTLSLIRILFGLVFLNKVTGFYRLLYDGKAMHFPRHLFKSESAYRLTEFRFPIPGFGWLPVPSYEMYNLLEVVFFILLLSFIVGFCVRYVGPIMACIYGYMFVLSQFTYHHHVFLLLLGLWILAFSPCGDHFSVDALLLKKKPAKAIMMYTRMLQVLISAILLFSGLSKLNWFWLKGDMIKSLNLRGPLMGLAESWNLFPVLGTTIVFSWIFLSIALWCKHIRLYAYILLVVIFICMDMSMSISTFAYQMIVLAVAFFDPDCKKWPLYKQGSQLFHRYIA